MSGVAGTSDRAKKFNFRMKYHAFGPLRPLTAPGIILSSKHIVAKWFGFQVLKKENKSGYSCWH